MKKNHIKSLMIVLAMSWVMGVTSTYAAGYCHNGAITRVVILDQAPSTEASVYKVQINCDEFSGERFYYLSSNIGDSGYATLLTAISLNKNLYMEMTGSAKGEIVTLLRLDNY